MLGGMSWESTSSYYKTINEGVKNALGNLHSAKIYLHSVDFEEIEKLQHLGKWDGAAEILSQAAKKIEACGADFLILCTNTMHKVAPTIEKNISIPFVHIADATAERLLSSGISRVGLLGTKFTMEQNFYKGRITENFNIHVITPTVDQQEIIHKIIYSELCLGIFNDNSRAEYLEVIEQLHEMGAEAVILGCTEIALLVSQQHTKVPLFDTTQIHAEQAIKLAIT